MSRTTVLCLICAAALVAAVGWLPILTLGVAHADEQPANSPSLKVWYSGTHPQYVLVELHKDGKLLRTHELKKRDNGNEVVAFGKLAGPYELHFQGAGYKKCIKRITIRQDDRDVRIHAELDKDKELVLGGGPSLQELEKRLADLERENAELKNERDRLTKN